MRPASLRARETDIMRATLVAVSALPGTMAWRNNTGALPLATGGWLRFGLVGSADIIGVRRGHAFAVEVKTPSGRTSIAQRRFRAAWEAAGGLYVVARCPEDALAALAAPRPAGG